MGRLEGKVAVITGGADGIGHAIGKAMAREGARVFLSDVDDSKGEAAAEAIRQAGGKAEYVHCDVGSDADIKGLIEGAVQKAGRIDVLVNNAAIAIGGMPVYEMTDEQWHKLININLTSVFRGCKHALRHMVAQKSGSIINMASAQGHIGLDGWTAYAGAKGAVMSMSRQMAVEFGPHNVRINSISPGTINTPMNEKVIAELGEPNGTFMQGDRDVLLYPNGTIEFRDGKALKIALVDPAEIAARDAAKAEAQRIEDEARQATIREGEEKIRLILETERFKNMTPAERVRTFDRIRRLHPGTPMPMEYETARDALAEKAKTAGAESAVSDKEKRLQELKDAQSKLSSAKRRRFNRTHSDEMKALEKELAKP